MIDFLLLVFFISVLAQLSEIARFLRESVNPMLLGLLSPHLPADVRASG